MDTRSWRAPRGSTAFFTVVGLVLLSVLMVGSSAARYGSLSAGGPADLVSDMWAPGSWMDQPSSMPSSFAGAREHLLTAWPPIRRALQPEAAHLRLPSAPGAGSESVLSPQQLVHRTTGSRSPPALV
ncbi:hypothetical protein ABT294_17715 [Nonomuraea sp. NPDC000554]|uniref:hypothetical protein n=1 Tax=Nonomuraea sp. NPDC000554 TaxID=3154259 RepID=UPI00332A4525